LLVGVVHVPLWIALVALLIGLSAFGWHNISGWRRSERRRIRAERGLCTRCAYDLRGLAGARCPECGARIAGSH
jgi:hypothetical protein